MKGRTTAVALLLAGLMLISSGCSLRKAPAVPAEARGSAAELTFDDAESAQWAPEPTPAPDPAPTPEGALELKLSVNGIELEVIWEENEAAEALKKLACDKALTVETHLYGGFEQVGSLGVSLPESDTRITAEAGDVILYSGDQIVLFFGSNTWEYTRLGRISGLDGEELESLLGGERATVVISAS